LGVFRAQGTSGGCKCRSLLLGELTALPKTLYIDLRGTSRRGKEREREKKREKEGKEGDRIDGRKRLLLEINFWLRPCSIQNHVIIGRLYGIPTSLPLDVPWYISLTSDYCHLNITNVY